MKFLATLSAGILFLILGVATVVHSQEPKEEEGKPAPHPEARHDTAAPAPRQEAAPPRSEPRPQAEPAARPPAPTPHEQRPPEARPQQEPAAHQTAPNPHEARPPQEDDHHRAIAPNQEARPPEPPNREHHEAPATNQGARPPEPPNRTAAPQPAPAPGPQSSARPAAEPSRTAERRAPAPTPEQQRDWDRHRAENWQAEHHTWRDRGGYRGYRIPEQRYQAYFGQPHVFRIYEYPVAFNNGYPRFQYGNYWVQVVDPWPNYWAPNWFYTDPVYVAYLGDGYYLIDTLYPDVPLAVEIFG